MGEELGIEHCDPCVVAVMFMANGAIWGTKKDNTELMPSFSILPCACIRPGFQQRGQQLARTVKIAASPKGIRQVDFLKEGSNADLIWTL